MEKHVLNVFLDDTSGEILHSQRGLKVRIIQCVLVRSLLLIIGGDKGRKFYVTSN